ncbi:MAG TPA: CBS domain-containing protein [Candidatus Bathyarchaeia archaeon]|nr:CBS domain-containing protein [Candidatus Bathyarchaeia archaeon]
MSLSKKLSKIMIEDVVTIRPSATVRQAAELMNLHEIGCLLVVDQEKPVGIITERDILKRVICRSKPSQKTKVGDLMSKPLITASSHMHAGEAAKLMLERNVKKLPVVEGGRLVGLVTITDLLRSQGVIEFLNTLSLDGTSRRIRKTIDLYYDEARIYRRTCPLSSKDGFAIGCQSTKCMWWVGDECAVTKLSRQVSTEEFAETNLAQENSSLLPP